MTPLAINWNCKQHGLGIVVFNLSYDNILANRAAFLADVGCDLPLLVWAWIVDAAVVSVAVELFSLGADRRGIVLQF